MNDKLVIEMCLKIQDVAGKMVPSQFSNDPMGTACQWHTVQMIANHILVSRVDPWFDVKLNYPEILTNKMREFVERLP